MNADCLCLITVKAVDRGGWGRGEAWGQAVMWLDNNSLRFYLFQN